jgi:hypothetical protein
VGSTVPPVAGAGAGAATSGFPQPASQTTANISAKDFKICTFIIWQMGVGFSTQQRGFSNKAVLDYVIKVQRN